MVVFYRETNDSGNLFISSWKQKALGCPYFSCFFFSDRYSFVAKRIENTKTS
jgi:hypothetical protein